MKDLYTFDHSSSRALETYHEVREMYCRLFDELKLPYLVAEADSGDIGGDLSHEFHFPTSKGEDHIISCTSCDYVANEELAESPVFKRNLEKFYVPEDAPEKPLSIIDVRKRIDTPQDKPVLVELVYNALSPSNGNRHGVKFTLRLWRGISRDRLTLVNVWYKSPSSWDESLGHDLSNGSEVNTHAVRAVVPDLDASIENPLQLWFRLSQPSDSANPTSPRPQRLVNLVDCSIPSEFQEFIKRDEHRVALYAPCHDESLENLKDVPFESMFEDPSTKQPFNFLRIKDGDPCPRCSQGSLRVQKAIELGHTFHLGTRYSEPLSATIVAPLEKQPGTPIATKGEGSSPRTVKGAKERPDSNKVPMQMGCHGIGVSRIVGAVADTLADGKGLNWPRVMAPFEVVVVPSSARNEGAAMEVYDTLAATGSSLDLVLDDRDKSMGVKMGDADLIGYPVIVIVGKSWLTNRQCEVQCRRLAVKKDKVPISELKEYVESLLAQI